MKERREYKRLTIPLPVRLEPETTGRKRVLDLKTRDISASGVFVNTLTIFPERTRFVMDFTIPSDSIEEFKYVKSLKGCTGSMVRSTSKGLAIHFDRDCYIVTLSGS
jgi:hypothetical protein